MRPGDPTILAFPGPAASPVGGFDLTVVVPAYNEAARLPGALDGLAQWCATQQRSIEVLVVDDGSRDDTAQAATVHHCGCSVIRLRRNSGKGAAVRTGMLLARGGIVAFTDADLPFDLAALRWACDVIDAGIATAVYGGRDLEGSAQTVRRSAARVIASWCFRKLSRHLVSHEVADTQCGLKIFRRDAAHDIFSRVRTDGFAFDAEAILVARRLGYVATRVPVRLVNEAGSTVSLRRHAPAMVRDMVAARLRHGRRAAACSGSLPEHDILQVAVPHREARRLAA